MPLADADARRLAENLHRVREQIAEAAIRSGRKSEDVRLVAVTKYVDVETARTLATAGCEDLGESRPQELWEKAEALGPVVSRWHMIGHLQRNKVRRTLPAVALIHSVDSWRLLQAIDAEAVALRRRQAVLLEVNVAGEEAKHGLSPADLDALIARLPELPHVAVGGLMTMAPLEGGPDAARRTFAELRALAERLRPACPDGVHLAELSMGMSGDFFEAVAEGSTIVRIGSALFEGVGP